MADKHMQRCAASLAVRGMQIKTALRYYNTFFFEDFFYSFETQRESMSKGRGQREREKQAPR